MIKNKKLLAALGIFTLWLYGAWAVFEMLLNPMLKEATDNEYILLLLRDGVIKNLVWTLPAVLLIKHFSDDMLVGMRELFGFKKAASKYLLIVLPLAAFVLLGELIRTHTIEVSSAYHPSQFIVILFVGFTEEIVFRGLYLNAAMKYADTNKKQYLAAGLNSLMFLAIHFPKWIMEGVFVNGFARFGFVTIIALSLLFSFCFVRSRNIWVPAVLHSFYDMMIFVLV